MEAAQKESYQLDLSIDEGLILTIKGEKIGGSKKHLDDKIYTMKKKNLALWFSDFSIHTNRNSSEMSLNVILL